MTIIYGLIDHMGTVRYVGCSRDPARRVWEHRSRGRRWAAGFVVLEEVPEGEDGYEYERKHVAIYRELVGDLLENVNDGGCGPVTGTFKHTSDVIEKIREAGTGRRHTDETKAKVSAAKMGHPPSGVPWTPERHAKVKATWAAKRAAQS